MVPVDRVASIELRELLNFLSFDGDGADVRTMTAVASALADGRRPVVPGVSVAPRVLLSLWPRLWPAARRQLSLRTLFGSEQVESGQAPHIVIIPAELCPRWRTHGIVGADSGEPVGAAVSWLCGGAVPSVERLLRPNWEGLPGDIAILTRIERIATVTARLRAGTGTLADALLIARTTEAFDGRLTLPGSDLALLIAHVSEMRSATVQDIRTASLVSLTVAADAASGASRATARWILENLPTTADADAIWILERQAHGHHVAWWIRAVREGLSCALGDLSPAWAMSLWRWWSMNPDAVGWTQSFLGRDSATESSLSAAMPSGLDGEVRTRLVALCAERQWAVLFARLVRRIEPVDEPVRMLREMMAEPERGLDVLLEVRSPGEVVAVASACTWRPLADRAGRLTVRDHGLLENMDPGAAGAIEVVAAHLRNGGGLTTRSIDDALVRRVFDGCINRKGVCLEVVPAIGARAGVVALTYPNIDELLEGLDPTQRQPLLDASAVAWLERFQAGAQVMEPGRVLGEAVCGGARAAFSGGPIGHVIRFLDEFAEVTEGALTEWLFEDKFLWRAGDAERLGDLLSERGWKVAARKCRYSWRGELKAVAWRARELLSYWDRPSAPPAMSSDDAEVGGLKPRGQPKGGMKILLLAANPATLPMLRIDEEVRSIEEKVRAAKLRGAVVIRSSWATRPGDLQQALLREDPMWFTSPGTVEAPTASCFIRERERT